MKRKYQTYEEYLIESLKDPVEAAYYMNAALEENDPAFLLIALAQVANAHGMAKEGKRVLYSRMGIYKSLSKHRNPELKTFMKLLSATGLEFSFKPKTATA
jgi:probable addiction module antidote protein